jgi:hypothetical protein
LAQRDSVRPVLWEQIAGSSAEGFINIGYTDNYVRVSAVHPRPLTNLTTPARLMDYVDQRHWMRVEPLIEG